MLEATTIHNDTQQYTTIHSDTQRYTAIHKRYTSDTSEVGQKCEWNMGSNPLDLTSDIRDISDTRDIGDMRDGRHISDILAT